MGTRFDNNVLLRVQDHFGFGATGAGTAEVSTAGRIINAANLAAVNGVVTAPAGSFALLDDGTVAVNTDSLTTWVLSGPGGNSDANIIADPGTGVAIPVGASGTIMITTAAAETNTMAAPTFVGQRITFYVDTYAVGDRVITVSAAINVANNTIMTFGAVSEGCTLQGVTLGGVLTWIVVANDNVSLS